jgi:hypothetical protein
MQRISLLYATCAICFQYAELRNRTFFQTKVIVDVDGLTTASCSATPAFPQLHILLVLPQLHLLRPRLLL